MTLELFLLVIFGLPALLITAPRAIYGWVSGLCWLLVGFLMWKASRPTSMADGGLGLDSTLVGAWGCLLALCWGVRKIFDACYYRKRQAPPIDRSPLWASLAVVVTGWAGWLFGPMLARLLLPLTVLLIASIVAVALGYAAWRLAGRARWASAATAMTMIVGIVAILSWPSRITQAAQNQAQGRPYCLMVADGYDGYRPATSILDLSPLIMRATESPWVRNQHGLMIVTDRPPRNFSYRRVGYVDVAALPRSGRTLCQPVRNFAEALPPW